jgi:hypothetical protein
MFRVLTLFLILIVSRVFAGPLEDAYQEGANIAKANQEKAAGHIQNNLADKYKDKDGKTYYTENPSETNYYQGVGSYNPGLENTGKEVGEKNEAVQAAKESRSKNTRVKIDPNEPWLASSKDIMKNATDIATGTSSKPGESVKPGTKPGVNCHESKICRIDFVKKVCNEARPLKRICGKAPKITTSTRDIVYPNCQQLIITQHVRSYCPAGYGEMFSADMVQTFDDHWDDIRFCARALAPGEGAECFSGAYYITSNRGSRDAGRVTVPKKLHARIGMSNVYYGFIIGTIINETTGQTIHSNAQFSNGQVINLPYSETQDQTFRFYATQPQGGGGGRFGRIGFANHRPGVMVLYIEHTKREAVANFEGWKEVDCREI